MPHWDNLGVKNTLEEIERTFEDEMLRGYNTDPYQSQPFFNKPYDQMKLSERGYIIGREIRMMEERAK